MLDGALAQLFLDLDAIPQAERSEYENALHVELLELAYRLQPLSRSLRFTAAALKVDLKTLEIAASDAGLQLVKSDSIRLRCEAPNCPNKRL
jgi:hypothetical protein